MTDFGPELRHAFDGVPPVDMARVEATAARRRIRRRRLRVTGGVGLAVAALVIVLLLVTPGKQTTVRVGPASASGVPAGAACARLASPAVPGGSSGQLRVPAFDAALLCQYLGASTGEMELSALASSTTVSGTEAMQLRDAFQSAPAWPQGVVCAVPSQQNPQVQVTLYRDFKPVGSILVSLTGCHMIQGPHGQANADGVFQAKLDRLLTADGAAAAGPIAGIWHVHTYNLSVSTDGHGVFTWPIHTSCGTGPGQGPPPCDTLRNGNEIIDGGYATLTIVQQAGHSATGTIKSSTDPSTLPDGSVTLRLASNDLLYLNIAGTQTPHPYEYLCGQQAASLPISQQNAEQINCGA